MIPPGTLEELAAIGANLSLNGSVYPPGVLTDIAAICHSKGTTLTVRNSSAVPPGTLTSLAAMLKGSLVIED